MRTLSCQLDSRYILLAESSQNALLTQKISVSSKAQYQYHPPEKPVKNKLKNDYALLQIPRICLIRMLSDIPISAVKNALIPMKHSSFSVGEGDALDIESMVLMLTAADFLFKSKKI
jgi:hypothetical protein